MSTKHEGTSMQLEWLHWHCISLLIIYIALFWLFFYHIECMHLKHIGPLTIKTMKILCQIYICSFKYVCTETDAKSQ